MNNGLFGFPVGKDVKYKKTVFTSSGIFIPSPNTKYVMVETQGAGGNGLNGTTSLSGAGGGPGLYASYFYKIDDVYPSCSVTIGASSSSTNTLVNTDTNKTLLKVSSGLDGQSQISYLGTGAFASLWGGSGSPVASGTPSLTKCGGWGAGGGGTGGGASGSSSPGSDGGVPCIFQVDYTTNQPLSLSGGAKGGQAAGENGANAVKLVRHFGEGAGGGAGNISGAGGNGGNGINGSGGGGGGRGSTAGGIGGTGGTGVMVFYEVCYHE